MRSDPGRYAARLALMLLLAALCVGASAPDAEEAAIAVPAEPASEDVAPVAAVVVHDPLYRLELALPAPYWQHADNRALAAEAQRTPGGCTPPQQVPDSLLLMFRHEDAPVLGRIELTERSFLVRDKAGLEEYVDARMAVIASQAGGAMQDVESSYATNGGMTTHRLGFTVPAGSGGGCTSAARGRPAMRYMVVHHFVRPKGADALLFVLHCFGPADAFERLKPEIDSVIESFRYTGELDAEFFAPDASEEKLLTAKDAAKDKPGGFNWLLPIGLAVMIWLLVRRKKEKAA